VTATELRAQQCELARTASDAVVQRKRPADYDAHKAERDERKSATRHFTVFLLANGRDARTERSRRDNPVRKKLYGRKLAAKKAAAGDAEGAAAITAGAGTTQRRIVQVPSEYMPPHKVLFIQQLPDDADKAALEALFSPCAVFWLLLGPASSR
jgi:U2 small nuclear ribonucleoprotein B''